MGERLLCKQEVAGSIPAGSIRKSLQEYRFRGLGRGAGRVVFLRCVPCVPHAREARAMHVGSLSDGPNARMGYAERYLHSEPTAYRRRAARPGVSAARPRSRRALAQPPACEARERPPPARCERKPQRNGTRAQCRLAWNSKATAAPLAFADAGVRREPIARCRTPGPRPFRSSDARPATRSHPGEKSSAVVGAAYRRRSAQSHGTR